MTQTEENTELLRVKFEIWLLCFNNQTTSTEIEEKIKEADVKYTRLYKLLKEDGNH